MEILAKYYFGTLVDISAHTSPIFSVQLYFTIEAQRKSYVGNVTNLLISLIIETEN